MCIHCCLHYRILLIYPLLRENHSEIDTGVVGFNSNSRLIYLVAFKMIETFHELQH